MSAAAIALFKKVLAKAVFDEEIRKKLLTVLITIFSLILVLLLALASFPAILISIIFGSTPESNPNLLDDIEKIAVYQDTIFIVDKLNRDWIESVKEENRDCDDFVVSYNYDLTWQALISIDSVLLNQDFRNMDSNKIQEIALKFINRTVDISEHEIEEEYEYEEEYEETIVGEDGKPKIVKKTRIITETRTVTKKIANIQVDTRNFEDVLYDVNIIDEESVFIATNIYNTISSMDVEKSLNIYDDAVIDIEQLQEYPEGNENIPYYNQTDKRWGLLPYGDGTILSAGCGPTSLSMVVSGLTGNKVTPDIVASWSVANGHRAKGLGSHWSLMTDGGSCYGLNVEAVSKRDPNSIVKALSQGYPVIASMGKGHFTKGGHFIVLRGITEDGKILVYDSASVDMYSSENAHGILDFNAEIELWTRAGKFKLNLGKGIDVRKLDKIIGQHIL
ncbi:C39 family peptidase [Proteiniborus sp. MB09-C3]|uniref:C39 family peptidase n=1 Tax=Proteiniborus sp. MB09-C3 TaxID=3050072 RepID=UPI002557B471|nr:C39 family peptidase [Proteiniborus sp. MB09-C3]WIV11115.1 C39 family peptidase [Proteiniborus sp. MB09-C3]